MNNDDPGLTAILHRIAYCPQCRQPMRLIVEKDVIQLYCYIHGRFEIRYLKGDWSIVYKFPTTV